MKLMQVLAIALTLMMMGLTAQAEKLNVHSVGEAPPNSPAGVLRPKSGMSMKQVVKQFGEPAQKVPAVGEPPISRWVYDKFTVYFEYQYVIWSVVNHKK
jgi:hypothetical protein